jgi:hypothetical protein
LSDKLENPKRLQPHIRGRIEACIMARSYQLVLLLYRLAHRFALSIFLTVVVATNALADKRAALVFGISNYQNVTD